MPGLIQLLIVLVVVGVVLYLIENYIQMDAMIRNIIRVVIVLAICIFLLRYAGLF